MKIKFNKGQRVVALGTITEGGESHPGKASVKFPQYGYVHAVVGDLGTVDQTAGHANGTATVRFDRTGTACMVGTGEVKIIPSPMASKESTAIGLRAAKERDVLRSVLADIIDYHDHAPWTRSTSASTRQDEEHELWEKARRLVGKPKPRPCSVRHPEDRHELCNLREGHDGPHINHRVRPVTWVI